MSIPVKLLTSLGVKIHHHADIPKDFVTFYFFLLPSLPGLISAGTHTSLVGQSCLLQCQAKIQLMPCPHSCTVTGRDAVKWLQVVFYKNSNRSRPAPLRFTGLLLAVRYCLPVLPKGKAPAEAV